MSRIITIGREFGSGGREIGKRLSDELGIAYYDNEIISQIADRTKLAEGYVQHVMENGPSTLYPITIGRSFYMGVDPIMEQNNAIYREQSRLIQEFAEKSDCVIVGRSADYILREKHPFRLFVYAEMEHKMERCKKRAPESEHFTDKELKRHILDVDKRRARYYQFFTGQTWGDRLNYDLCINTSNYDINRMHGKNRFPIYFTDICDAGYMGNFYGIIAACGGGGAGISVGISHACALIRNTSVFHISPGLHPEKNPVGNPVVTDRNEESGKGSGNTVFGAGDGACSDDRYG